jgi:hypothetical protein
VARGRLAAALVIAVVAGVAATACWLTVRGDVDDVPWPLGLVAEPAEGADQRTLVPVRLESAPSGAEVRVDGKRRGQTPALLSLAPGSHRLVIQKSDALEHALPLEVAAGGASLSVHLWRRDLDIIPVRPVLPGASLTDARFGANGVLGLTVNSPAGSSATQNREQTGTWQLDPETGSLVRLPFASSLQSSVHAAALAQDGKQVAYAVGGSGTSGRVRRLGARECQPRQREVGVHCTRP